MIGTQTFDLCGTFKVALIMVVLDDFCGEFSLNDHIADVCGETFIELRDWITIGVIDDKLCTVGFFHLLLGVGFF